jgi:hypothetical protein
MSAFVDAMVTFLRDNLGAGRESRQRPVPGEAKARLTLYPPARDRVERINNKSAPRRQVGGRSNSRRSVP